jgi:RNA polymerase sigma-70 factor (ECF subfamily)
MEAPSDADTVEGAWVARARQGDLEAFDWLMTRYRERAVRLASHVLHRPDEAEDVVQEAFLRVFAQMPDFRGDAHFYTWLYRIVVRCCLNRMRIPYWRREQVFLSETQADSEDRSQASIQTENRLEIETLLERLSPPLRAALVLRDREGLGYEEIAEVLQIPTGTVRSRLSAARRQFRAMWREAQEETNHV